MCKSLITLVDSFMAQTYHSLPLQAEPLLDPHHTTLPLQVTPHPPVVEDTHQERGVMPHQATNTHKVVARAGPKHHHRRPISHPHNPSRPRLYPRTPGSPPPTRVSQPWLWCHKALWHHSCSLKNIFIGEENT